MSTKHLVASSLLFLGPLAAFAQQELQLYVGAGAALSPATPSSYARLGPAATVGLQLSSRWALQTGVQLQWHSYSYPEEQAVGYGIYHARFTSLTVPLLARYTFTNPASHWQVEGLGGGSWRRSNGLFTLDYGFPVASPFEARYVSNQATLLLGPQVRYRLGSAFALHLNLPVNLVVASNKPVADRWFLTPQLGGQYTFGGASTVR